MKTQKRVFVVLIILFISALLTACGAVIVEATGTLKSVSQIEDSEFVLITVKDVTIVEVASGAERTNEENITTSVPYLNLDGAQIGDKVVLLCSRVRGIAIIHDSSCYIPVNK